LIAAAFAAVALVVPPAEAAAPAPQAPAAPAVTTQHAPATFKVSLDTSKGPIVIEVTRAWAPRGADRFYNLVNSGYFSEARFFRVLPGFMAQVGINADPRVSSAWRAAPIQDDPVTQSNTRGMVTFATAGPNTRTTQIFINFDDNSALDRQGFAPFGRVISGMEAADKLFSGYGEGAPRGPGPDQQLAQFQGNVYLNRAFPNLDYIRTATIVP
jgi:peptidyl-prolyl cis-trans isomerase A (cyclophilin A)